MIPPIPPSAAAAGARATGSITGALVSRYRPAGVPRTGSTEDRAASYQRLLDAISAAQTTIYLFRYLPKNAADNSTQAALPLLQPIRRAFAERQALEALTPQVGRVFDVSAELLAALGAVQLRGTLTVITAAEALVAAVGDLEETSAPDDAFDKTFRALVDARTAFLHAARTDLGYHTKPYQLLRRHRERKFLRRQQEQPALEA
jgi:hypothetical protein